MRKSLSKISLLVIIGIMLVGVAGCDKKSLKSNEKLEDIMTELYAGIPDEEKPMYLENIEVNEENIEGFIGTSDIEYEKIIASESMIGSVAHSVVLIRTKDNADINKIKETIKENVNPRKWICVGIEKDEVIIKNKGNLVVVIIVQNETNREKISKNFDSL